MQLSTADSRLFGFDDSGRWFENLRGAERSAILGSLGSYELIEELGRGGQGVVFRAVQPGTGRPIALKRLLAGSFATPAQQRRFEREMEVAAALNHPGLVTVYGTEIVNGQSVLAMEWVNGVPITDWARSLAGTPKARRRILDAFAELCAAVQHAHQNGILHRDLKPSNVLVETNGRPRVLDFGLAKFADERARGELSQSSEPMATPAYAAPELLAGNPHQVDSRSDVYSLGAILFELLTGRRLIEGSGLEAMVHALERRDPPRPSSLDRSIGSELDAIVLQALAPERERRYQSVDALATDLKRYLAGETVLAHPPGAGYVLRKFVARHRAVSGLVVLLVLSTITYVWLSFRQARRLSDERDRANREGAAAQIARDESERHAAAARAAESQAQLERGRALEEARNAQSSLDFLAEDVLAATDPRKLGHDPTVAEVVAAATDKIGVRFVDSPRLSIKVREVLARSLESLGKYREAEKVLRPALELCEKAGDPAQVGRVERTLGDLLGSLGQGREAEELLGSAIEHLESASPPDPEALASARASMGAHLVRMSRADEAIPLLERALEHCGTNQTAGFMLDLADAYFMRGGDGLEKARALLEEALAKETELHGEETELASSLLDRLAMVLDEYHDCPRAIPLRRKALEICIRQFGAAHPETAIRMDRLATSLGQCGELEEAETLARQSLDIARRADNACEVPRFLFNLGVLLENQSRFAEAEPVLREGVQTATRCFGPDSSVRLASASQLAEALTFLGKFDEADEILRDLAARRRRSGPPDQLAITLYHQGRLAVETGDDEMAIASFEEAISILEKEGTPFALAEVLRCYAAFRRDRGDVAAAEALEQQMQELHARMAPESLWAGEREK